MTALDGNAATFVTQNEPDTSPAPSDQDAELRHLALLRQERREDAHGRQCAVDAEVYDGGVRAWRTAAEGLDGHQRDFLNDVRVFRTTGTYTSPEHLRTGVEKRLRTLAAETAAVQQRPGRPATRFSVNNLSADDVTEAALRSVLFGESAEMSLSGMLPQMSNPLAAMAGLRLPEDAYAQIVRLLLAEELVVSGHVGQPIAVRVNPPRRGSRTLTLDWLPPRDFSDVDLQRRSVTGELAST